MDDLSKYYEDRSFVRWVYHPDPGLNAQWQQYLLEHPEEKKNVLLVKTILLPLRPKSDGNEELKALELFTALNQRLEQQKKALKIRKLGLSFIRYAAIALIFLAIGTLWTRTRDQSTLSPLNNQLSQVDQPEDNTVLILADGKNIPILEKKSSVQIRKDGQIIINRKDTIIKGAESIKGFNQLIVPYGRNSSIRLPDGTLAFLNAGSKLIYPSSFEGKTREVMLTGEGFFEVAHFAEQPFIVKSEQLNIRVLGTKFNVMAYPTDTMTEVALAEGKVELSETHFKILSGKKLLSPGQLASYDHESGEMSVKNVSIENYISWHNGYLDCKSKELNSILSRLERYYNIEIGLDNPQTGNKKISGKLKLEDNQDDVLKVLASSASLKLQKINEHEYTLK